MVEASQKYKKLHWNILDTLEKQSSHKASNFNRMLSGTIDMVFRNKYLEEITLFDESFAKYFGFTEKDVEELLEKICQQADINGQEKDKIKDAVKNWYKGYLIDKTTIYNPYSIMSFIREYMQTLDLEKSLKCYWANNSEIKFIKQCYKRLSESRQASLEELFAYQAVAQTRSEFV